MEKTEDKHRLPARQNMLSAYYYSFHETGVEAVDMVLAAVAWAGKAHHNTDVWTDFHDENGSNVVDKIQFHAEQAAAQFKSLQAEKAELARNAAAMINSAKAENWDAFWGLANEFIQKHGVEHDR